MSIAKTLLNSARTVPETGETGWGSEVTQILVDLIDSNNVTVNKLASGALVLVFGVDTPAALAASATITPVDQEMRIQSTGGAVIIDTTTPIAAGEFDGQQLELTGLSDTNTVEIQDSGNVAQNGDIILGLGDVIRYWWDNTRSVWQEQFRNT
jgi:hypothetical protein